MKRCLAPVVALLSAVLSKSHYVTQFARMVVRTHDNDGNANMDTNGEKRVQLLISSFSLPQSVFVDVGANVGNWSAALAGSGAQGRLVAVDPLSRNLSSVREKLEHLGWKKYDLCELALSESPGRVKFFTNQDRALSSHDSLLDMRAIGYAESVDCIEVSTETLDNLAARLDISDILFLKIDVEGNELSVLKGAAVLLGRGAVEFIQIEFGHAARAARVYLHDIVSFVGRYEYDMFIIKPNGLERLDFTPFTENRYAYVNLLIARRASLPKLRSDILQR